jgi:hypothetical protein
MVQKKEKKKDKATQLQFEAKPWWFWAFTVFCLAVCVVNVFSQE